MLESLEPSATRLLGCLRETHSVPVLPTGGGARVGLAQTVVVLRHQVLWCPAMQALCRRQQPPAPTEGSCQPLVIPPVSLSVSVKFPPAIFT